MFNPPRLLEVKPLPDYKLWLRYSDGVSGTLSFSPFVGQGIFKEWLDPTYFEQVRIGVDGSARWSNDLVLFSGSLYRKLTDKTAENLAKSCDEFYKRRNTLFGFWLGFLLLFPAVLVLQQKGFSEGQIMAVCLAYMSTIAISGYNLNNFRCPACGDRFLSLARARMRF